MKERNEVSKTRKRANLLKKKVLSAGNLGPKPDKGNYINSFIYIHIYLYICFLFFITIMTLLTDLTQT